MLLYCILFVVCNHVIASTNKSVLLTSSYSNVDHWQGRMRIHSQTVQPTYWTQRIYTPFRKSDSIMKTDAYPSRTDVIQKRFIPKPWFGYDSGGNKSGETVSSGNSRPAMEYVTPVPFDSFPLPLRITPDSSDKDNRPNEASMPGVDMKPPSSESSNVFNNVFVTYSSDDEKMPQVYTVGADAMVTDSYEYFPQEDLGKPDQKPPKNSYGMDPGKDAYGNEPAKDSYGMSPPGDSIPMMQNDSTVSKPDDQFHDFPAYLDHDPHAHGYGFDHYYHHYDHYHEITTTTTQAPEDERVNKRPYSYYYLGRKLWYIPLYFSVYFIIYIFLLILKSIARHKITFNHYFEQDKRAMDEPKMRMDELDHHVRSQIDAARKKYIL